MMIDDALGVARCTRSIIEGDCFPLVFRPAPIEIWVSQADERFIVMSATAFARLGEFLIVVIDDDRRRLRQRKRFVIVAENSRSVIRSLVSA